MPSLRRFTAWHSTHCLAVNNALPGEEALVFAPGSDFGFVRLAEDLGALEPCDFAAEAAVGTTQTSRATTLNESARLKADGRLRRALRSWRISREAVMSGSIGLC